MSGTTRLWMIISLSLDLIWQSKWHHFLKTWNLHFDLFGYLEILFVFLILSLFFKWLVSKRWDRVRHGVELFGISFIIWDLVHCSLSVFLMINSYSLLNIGIALGCWCEFWVIFSYSNNETWAVIQFTKMW